MAPFHFQIEALAHQAAWGIEAVKNGVFAPSGRIAPQPFSDLRTRVHRAEVLVMGSTPDEVNSSKNEVGVHPSGKTWLSFTPADYILSFALTNFHLHAVTAFDILRSRGVPIGKRDYEGVLRTRSA